MDIHIESSDPEAISPSAIAAILTESGYIVLSVTVAGFQDGSEDVWNRPEPSGQIRYEEGRV